MCEVEGEEEQFLYSFKKQYLQIVPLYNWKWQPIPSTIALNTQAEILSIIKKNQKLNNIPDSYTTQILKKIISIAERNFCEINEDLLNFYLDLLSQEGSKSSNDMKYISGSTKITDNDDNTWWKIYSLDKECTNILRILEDKSMISKGTTGLRTWEASLRLSEYFIQNPNLCEGKNIIELGAGIGLLSLICAKLRAKSIIATDVNEDVIQRLHDNIESNKIILTEANLAIPQVGKLDWNEKELNTSVYGDLDLIICADVIYNPENIEPLVNILSQFLKSIPSITIILCNPLRQQSTYDLFLEQLSQHNITIYKELIDKVPVVFCHDEEFSQIQMTIINKKEN